MAVRIGVLICGVTLSSSKRLVDWLLTTVNDSFARGTLHKKNSKIKDSVFYLCKSQHCFWRKFHNYSDEQSLLKNVMTRPTM
jgi:hypothetical protein